MTLTKIFCLLSIAIIFLGDLFAKIDPLPSWNDGEAKKSILEFVQATTDPLNPDYVSEEFRIAVFDQDGTLWVEQPMYTQVIYSLDRLKSIVEQKPEIKNQEPFKSILLEGVSAIKKLSHSDLEAILSVTLSRMTVEAFRDEVAKWLKVAKHPRWNKPYTALVYQPMLELMQHLRANHYKTYIVTGGGQDFVRAYAEEVYGIPSEQVIGSAGWTKYEYSKDGQSLLIKEPKLLLNDNFAGKPEGIHLMIGRRPLVAIGNSIGDQQMLEYVKFGKGKKLAMLLLHDDWEREYAYGPAQGLPYSDVGTFSQALYDEARKNDWIIISMKDDWNRVFSFGT